MYYRLKYLVMSVIVLLIITIIFASVNRTVSLVTSFLALLATVASLYFFLKSWNRKEIGKIKIESLEFARNYVIRSYLRQKNLWIVYEKQNRTMRPANLGDFPLNVYLIFFIGFFFLSTTYTIVTSLIAFEQLIVIRSIVAFIFLIIGFYATFISLARIFTLTNKKSSDFCKQLNKNKTLNNFLAKENVIFRITPNFLLTGGVVTSVEFIIKNRPKGNVAEKLLVDISKRISKL